MSNKCKHHLHYDTCQINKAKAQQPQYLLLQHITHRDSDKRVNTLCQITAMLKLSHAYFQQAETITFLIKSTKIMSKKGLRIFNYWVNH